MEPLKNLEHLAYKEKPVYIWVVAILNLIILGVNINSLRLNRTLKKNFKK